VATVNQVRESTSPPPALAPGLPGILPAFPSILPRILSHVGTLAARILPAFARLLSGVLLAHSGVLARLGSRQILVSRSSRFILSKREWRAHREGEHGHE
jgi:hypothetical protein